MAREHKDSHGKHPTLDARGQVVWKSGHHAKPTVDANGNVAWTPAPPGAQGLG